MAMGRVVLVLGCILLHHFLCYRPAPLFALIFICSHLYLLSLPFLVSRSTIPMIVCASQKNWIWDNLDRNFVVQTEMMGDIHHFAWRARHRNQTVYVHKRDAERFGRWPSVMCDTVRTDCVFRCVGRCVRKCGGVRCCSLHKGRRSPHKAWVFHQI